MGAPRQKAKTGFIGRAAGTDCGTRQRSRGSPIPRPTKPAAATLPTTATVLEQLSRAKVGRRLPRYRPETARRPATASL